MKNVIRLVDGVPELVQDDPWVVIKDDQELSVDERAIVPANSWVARQPAAVLAGDEISSDGVLFSAEDEFADWQDRLNVIPLIAIEFSSFRDGRGYSQAYLLRSRYHFEGELRAIGDVLRDQLSYMRQCGFNSFAVRQDKSAVDALKGLAGVSVLYGRSVVEPRPLYRRR